MEIDLSDDVLERFAIFVQDLPAVYADEEYQRLIKEEKERIAAEKEKIKNA